MGSSRRAQANLRTLPWAWFYFAEVVERTKQSKKAAFRRLGQRRAGVLRLQPSVVDPEGQKINAGAMQGKLCSESAGDAAGDLQALARRRRPALGERGGDAFDYDHPAPSRGLGCTVSGVLEEWWSPRSTACRWSRRPTRSTLPTRACSISCGAQPAAFCAQGKPLRKVTLVRATVL